MNDKKICFITAVNNEIDYNESVFYINRLEVPNDFEVEIIPIRDATSITSAYNQGMQLSNSKYKVYLHQDVLIINKKFIYDILKIFEDSSVGLIGMCGSKDMPINPEWWFSSNKYGKVYESGYNLMKLLEFQQVKDKYERVKCVDGLIIITQHDIPWRQEIFKGWHYYDLSQCMEFEKRGYKVAVPRQDEPWCIHECGTPIISNGFYSAKEKFIKEYLNNC